jgi:hypothetical protein
MYFLLFRIPSYDEIINQHEDDDDEEFEKAEEFERKFNFRYQEPDSEFVCFHIYIFLIKKKNIFFLL